MKTTAVSLFLALSTAIGCGNLPGPTEGPVLVPPDDPYDPPDDGPGIHFSATGSEIAWIIGSFTAWDWSPFTSNVYAVYPNEVCGVWTLDAAEEPILEVNVNDVPLTHVRSDTTGNYFLFIPRIDGSVDTFPSNEDSLCAMNVQIWDDSGKQITGQGFKHSASWNNYRLGPVDGPDGFMMQNTHAYIYVQHPVGWDIWEDPWWCTVNGDTLRYVTDHRGPYTFYFFLNRNCRIENPAENWPMSIWVD